MLIIENNGDTSSKIVNSNTSLKFVVCLASLLPVTEDEGIGANVITESIWNISYYYIYLSCLNVKEMLERWGRKLHYDGQTNGLGNESERKEDSR
jgi:hypothetical protein